MTKWPVQKQQHIEQQDTHTTTRRNSHLEQNVFVLIQKS